MNYQDSLIYRAALTSDQRLATSHPNPNPGSDSKSVVFSSLIYKGLPIYGTCPAWTSFSASDLTPPYDDLTYSSVTIVSLSYSFKSKSFISNFSSVCPDPLVARSLALTLQSVDLTSAYSAPCDGNTWRVFSCFGQRILCVNCKKVCVSQVACGGAWAADGAAAGSFPSLAVLHPCTPSSACPLRPAPGDLRAASYVGAAFQVARRPEAVPLSYPHLTLPLNLTLTYPSLPLNSSLSSSASIVVRTSLDRPGNIYCAAFPSGSGQGIGSASRILFMEK